MRINPSAIGYFFIILLTSCMNQDTETVFFIPQKLAEDIQQSREFDPEIVAQLEQHKANATDPRQKGVFKFLLIGQKELPGSTTDSMTIRSELENLSQEFAGTWLSALAKIKIAGIHLSHDAHQEKITLLLDALNDPGLYEIGDPQKNPLLTAFPNDEESLAIAQNPEDLVLFLLVSEHARAFDLKSAEAAADQIQSQVWRSQAESSLERLRALDAQELQVRRQQFLDQQQR